MHHRGHKACVKELAAAERGVEDRGGNRRWNQKVACERMY